MALVVLDQTFLPLLGPVDMPRNRWPSWTDRRKAKKIANEMLERWKTP